MSVDSIPDGEKAVSLTELRRNVYHLVDEVIATGRPLAVKRGGTLLRLGVISSSESKLGNLKCRDTILDTTQPVESELPFEWNPENGFD